MIANVVIGPPDDEAMAVLDSAGYEGFEARQWAKGAPEAALHQLLNSDCGATDKQEYTDWLLTAIAAHEELFRRGSLANSQLLH